MIKRNKCYDYEFGKRACGKIRKKTIEDFQKSYEIKSIFEVWEEKESKCPKCGAASVKEDYNNIDGLHTGLCYDCNNKIYNKFMSKHSMDYSKVRRSSKF